jgi:hypothetical protein
MSALDNIVFSKKKFSDILEEIYDNQKKKEKQISALISELKPLINDIGDATLIVPLIKEYMEIGVKNDEQLIKMSTIIQRILNSSSVDASDYGISEEEKAQLLTEIQKIKTTTTSTKIAFLIYSNLLVRLTNISSTNTDYVCVSGNTSFKSVNDKILYYGDR